MKSNIMSYLMNVSQVSADCLQRQFEEHGIHTI